APMIVGCISGESRSLSGSPFKTLESFLSRVLFYTRLKKTDKKRQELALPPFFYSFFVRYLYIF
ncbi:MAG: hypothetical protein KIC86_10870, partial [Sutterella sp.]|nr:hypothetical protein [Sutterella sp.]